MESPSNKSAGLKEQRSSEKEVVQRAAEYEEFVADGPGSQVDDHVWTVDNGRRVDLE